MIESYQEKKTSYEKLTKSISIEKEILQSEISKETIDGIKTKELQNDAFLKEMDTNKDLKRADPALTSALAALDSLDRRELECEENLPLFIVLQLPSSLLSNESKAASALVSAGSALLRSLLVSISFKKASFCNSFVFIPSIVSLDISDCKISFSIDIDFVNFS